MENCIFCKIVEGKIPCAKIWEDEKFLAFLDIRPVMKGMTLVIPKDHHGSYIFEQNDSLILEIIKSGKIVAKMLEKALDVSRVALVAEGVGVNHLHLKLYPLHGFDPKTVFDTTKEELYFEKYEGFVSTQMGPQAEPEDLKKLAEFIVEKNKQ